ncbi:MAG: thiamine phosphate synthase [Casimicrobiaceae bacterium]
MPATATDALVSPRTRDSAQRGVRGLYAVTPDLADTAELVARVRAAIDGGATVIQYRNKAASGELRSEQALALLHVCARRAALIVNDDAALAARIGADGVHVGEHDGNVAAARAIVGGRAIIGVSCYDAFDTALAAVDAGADYVAFGGFFPSRTKPGARHAELSLLRRAQALPVPVVAIGGITLANAATLVDAGADALAVISAVFDQPSFAEVTLAARAFAQAFDGRAARLAEPAR